MRVGFFGNSNNYPLTLALGFRKLGADTMMIVDNKAVLHSPEHKKLLDGEASSWIHDFSHLDEQDWVCQTSKISPVLNLLETCEMLVLSGLGPSLSNLVGRPTVALLVGSDLLYYANFKSADVRSMSWDHNFRRSAGGRLANRRWIEFVLRQRDGIAAANLVSYPWKGLVPDADELLKEIGVPDGRRTFVYLSDTINNSPRKLRNDLPFTVLNGARLCWKEPPPPGFSSQDMKGTDILLQGFAQFARENHDAKLKLVRKGPHVAETNALLEKLALTSKVEWLDEMPLSKFMDEVVAADVIADQFGPSFPGMTTLDAMAAGRPVLANFRLDILQKSFPREWPVCHARNPSEVADWLGRLAGSFELRTKLSTEARQFAEEFLSPEANAKRCLDALNIQV